MKQFAIEEPKPALLVGLNLRREKHGKAKVPAFDVKVQVTAPNTILDQLKGPGFRAGLYTRSDGEEAQGDLDHIDPATETPLLRLEGIEPIHLQDELTGYGVTFDIGTGRKDSIVQLDGCKLADFVVEPLQGGTVRVNFKIQKAGVDEKQIGKLGVLIDCEVGLTLTPPDPESGVQKTLADAGGGG